MGFVRVGFVLRKTRKRVSLRENSVAQSTIETLIVLSIGVFILTALVAIVYDQLNTSAALEQQKVAQNAVRTLAREIDSAYFLGPGTVKNVLIKMPADVDLAHSFIQGRGVVLRVNGTDVAAETHIETRGSWPNVDGSVVFVITAFNDFVVVSTQPLSFSPSQVNEALLQGASKEVNISILNTTSTSVTYTPQIEFPNPATGVASAQALSVSPIVFNANEDALFTFTLSCSHEAFGAYAGNIVFVPTNPTDTNLSVPITLVCVSSQTKLSLFPTNKLISAFSGESSSDSMLACNNSATVLRSVSARVSGAANQYVFTNFLEDVGAYSCAQVNLSVRAPASISNYLGTITLTSGSITAVSDINLVVTPGAANFDINWASAYFSSDNNAILRLSLKNNGLAKTVSQIKVLVVNDLDDTNVVGVVFDGVNVLSASTRTNSFGTASVSIGAGSTVHDVNILFNKNVHNDSEKFRLVFRFTQGTDYWSPIFDDMNKIRDYNVSDFNAGALKQQVVADGNGAYLAQSGGVYYADGNFYSRVFDFNGRVDFNQISWTSFLLGNSLTSKSQTSSQIVNDFNKAYFATYRTDINNWVATGELDWNVQDVGVPLSSTNSLWDTNLIGVWHFDDKNAQGWVLNSKTNVRDGNLFGGADVNASGLWGTTSLGIYSGTNSSVDLSGVVNTFEGWNAGTLSLWFKGTASAYLFSINDKDTVQNYNWFFVGNSTGAYPDESLGFALTRDNSSKLQMYVRNGHTAYLDGRWHNFVLSTGGGSNFISVDGVPQTVTYAVGSSSTNEFSNITSQDTMQFGDAKYSPLNANGAVIDEVAIWNKALSVTAVNALYLSQKGNFVDANLVGYWKFNSRTRGVETDYARSFVTQGLVGWWKLDDGSGTSAVDSSGSSNTGTLVNTPPWSVPSNPQINYTNPYCLSFNGSTQYVNLGTGASLRLANTFTWSAWVNSSSFANRQIILAVGKDWGTDFPGPSLSIQTNGKLQFLQYATVSDIYNYSANTALTTGSYYHVAVTFNNSAPAGSRVQFFINGAPVTSTVSSDSSSPCTFQTGVPALLGMVRNSGAYNYYPFSGLIDDVRVYNRVLTSDEIKSMYDTQLVLDSARATKGVLLGGADINGAGVWDSNALFLSGASGNGISIPNIYLSNNFSILYWVKTNSYNSCASSTGCMPIGGSSISQGYLWDVNATHLQVSNDGETKFFRGRIQDFNDFGWRAIAVIVRDGNVQLFKNGVLQSYSAFATPFDINISKIGYAYSSASYKYSGLIDEVKIYTRALLASEVLADYNRFLQAKLVDVNIFDVGRTVDWNSVRVNKTVGYRFNKELEDWNTLKTMGVNQLGSSSDSNYLFNDANILAVWHFNDKNAQGWVMNSKTGARDANVSSGADINQTGLWDTNALWFNGTSGYLQTTDSNLYNMGTKDFTISAWINLRSTSITQGIFHKRDSAANSLGYVFYVDTSAKLNALGRETGQASSYGVGSTSIAVPLNQWVHVVGVFDRVNGYSLYQDGALLRVTTSGTLSLQDASIDNNGFVNIGRSSGVNYFAGQIEEVSVWNRALSANEVSDLYNSQKPSFSNGLVGLWHLNDKNASGFVLNSATGVRDGNIFGRADTNAVGLWDTNAGWFDGNSGYVNLGNILNINYPLSVSAWVKRRTGGSTYKDIISHGANGFNLSIYPDGTINLGKQNVAVIVKSAGNINDIDKWHHVAATFDGTTGVVFLDGVLDKATVYPVSFTGPTNLYIGNAPGVTEYFSGSIEDVAIWSRVLSNSEVKDLYRKGVSRLDVNVYSCSDLSCSTKTGAQYITDINTGGSVDLNANIRNSRYLGVDAFFTKNNSFVDYNAGTFWAGAFLQDVVVQYTQSSADTNIVLFARASDNNILWSTWEQVSAISPYTLLLDNNRYFQYWARLSTANTSVAPVLSDVNVSYNRIDS